MTDNAALNVEHETSVDDDLRNAFAALKERDAGAVTDPVIEETAEVKAARARDEAVATDAGADPIAGTDQAKPTVKAPDGWTAAAKAKFATLEPDVQAEIARRESELTKKITSQDDERTLGKRIREITLPYTAIMNAEGATIETTVQSLLNTAYILRTGSQQAKIHALHAVAQQFNIPLGQVPQQQAQIDPAIETLQQRLDRIERERQAESQSRQQLEQDAIAGQIEEFRTQPGHEHYETVKSLMGSLLVGGHAKDMQDAYDQACHANPAIRSTLTAAQTAQAEEKRLADLKAKAEAARRAGGSVVGGPGGAKAPANANGQSNLSIEDELRAQFRAASGRV